jgi:hypothetical protein
MSLSMSNLSSFLGFKEDVGLTFIVVAIIINIGYVLPSQASFPRNYYIDLQKFKFLFRK